LIEQKKIYIYIYISCERTNERWDEIARAEFLPRARNPICCADALTRRSVLGLFNVWGLQAWGNNNALLLLFFLLFFSSPKDYVCQWFPPGPRQMIIDFVVFQLIYPRKLSRASAANSPLSHARRRNSPTLHLQSRDVIILYRYNMYMRSLRDNNNI